MHNNVIDFNMPFIKCKSYNKVVCAKAFEGINITKEDKNQVRNMSDLTIYLGLLNSFQDPRARTTYKTYALRLRVTVC